VTTRHQFDQALAELSGKITQLGNIVQGRISLAMESMLQQNLEKANDVIVGDIEVNDLQADIEEQCMLLIATQQPFARDLRKIVAGFKISISLERIGDLAADVAKSTLRIGDTQLIKPLIDLPRMAELVRTMIDKGIKACIDEDDAAAREMAKMDDKVDHLHNQIFRELLLLMIENPKTITQATHLMFTSRFFERMGDYCTNIAEEVVYLVNGNRTDLNE